MSSISQTRQRESVVAGKRQIRYEQARLPMHRKIRMLEKMKRAAKTVGVARKTAS